MTGTSSLPTASRERQVGVMPPHGADEVLAFRRGREREAKAAVLAERGGIFRRIPLREVVARGTGIDAVHRRADVGGEFHMLAEGADRDLRGPADGKDKRENVVIVELDFHDVCPFLFSILSRV